MKEIDFRPNWYCVIRRRKRNAVIRVSLLGVLAVELILGSVGIVNQKAAARQEIEGLRDDFERQMEVFKDLDKKLALLDGLHRKRELLSDVSGGAPVHGMLAELSQLMPDDVVLTEVRVNQQRRIRAARGVVEDEAEMPVPSENDGVGRFEITGWASSDVSVGALMTNMANSKLYQDVTLSYSQPVVVKRRVAREFKLTCVFPQFE